MKVENVVRLIEGAEAVPFDEGMMIVPGFVGELARYTLRTSHSPNSVAALTGALAMLSHLSGRSYRDAFGTRTNIYFVVLGETGIGKDRPRAVNNLVAGAARIMGSMVDSTASGEGIEDALMRSPNLMIMSDEVESFFSAMHSRHSDALGMSSRMRRLYTASSGYYTTRAKAGEGNGVTVQSPHVTLFGSGVPSEFYKTIDMREVRNGLFGRCLIVTAEDEFKSALPEQEELPQGIVETACMLADLERNASAEMSFGSLVVSHTAEAINKMKELNEWLLARRKALSASEEKTIEKALLARLGEKISRLALVWAISENPEQPVITADAVIWATKFAAWATRQMLDNTQLYIGESAYDLQKKRILRLITKNGGTIGRRQLIRSLHQNLTAIEKVVKTMIISGEIAAEEVGHNRVQYTIKAA